MRMSIWANTKNSGRASFGQMSKRWPLWPQWSTVCVAQERRGIQAPKHNTNCGAWWRQHHGMGLLCCKWYWLAAEDWWHHEKRGLPDNLTDKPEKLSPEPELGLPAWQRPEAFSKSGIGVAQAEQSEGDEVSVASPVANFRFPNSIALYLSEATWIENKYQSLTWTLTK